MERRDRTLVIGLASALGLALLVISFLLGRGSAKPAASVGVVPPSAMPVATVADTAAPPSSVAVTPEAANPAPTLAEFAPPLSNASPALVATPLAPSAIPHGTPPSDQPQIAAYFSQVDRLEDMGGGDPQAFASSIVQSMSSGDFSGFDSLLSKARAQRQRLQAISPPRACAEHHRLALTLSADSVGMLERLKAAMTQGDTSALMTIATEGKALEAQTSQLKAMAESIKRQAGLS